jgi:hypothetical protein
MDAAMHNSETRRNVIYAGIELEIAAIFTRTRAGALLDQIVHLDDGRHARG